MVDEGKENSPLATSGGGYSQDIFQGLGMMNSMRNIHNQIIILGSTPVVSRTIDELDFEVSYYSVEGFITSELYKEAPFQVIWEKNHPQLIDADFYVTMLPGRKTLG